MTRNEAGTATDTGNGRSGTRGAARVGAFAAFAAFAVLAGCATAPEPLTPAETALRVENDLARLAAARPALDGPLTLHGAMARALLHNPDARAEAMAHSLALRQTEMARLGLLPALTGRFGVETRSNVQASSSRSVRTGLESLSASTSNDRPGLAGNLAAVWHTLDFGVSYYGAKQQSDRALIAHQRGRRAVQQAVAAVRGAWWRAVAGERALVRLEPLLERVRSALAASERFAAQQMFSPVEALRYQRALLEAVDALERQRREIRLAKIELARLIGLAPGTPYRLALPDPVPRPRALAVDPDELAALALAGRPDLIEGHLDERIAVREVRKAMLRMLPGIELRAGAHVDGNSYLVNHDWLSLAAAVTVNLTELFTRPAAIAAARAERELAVARREALSMAVLAQLYVALARFEEALGQHATADRIAGLESRILETLESESQVGASNRLQTIRAEIDVLRAQLARDRSLAEAEDSFGRIFLSVGADIAPVASAQPTLEELTIAVAATEAAWSRGEIEVRPWSGTDGAAGGTAKPNGSGKAP